MISFVGMQTQEVTIKPHVKVILKSDSELLEEVVVTGYGTFKKASFTGAASTVNTSTLKMYLFFLLPTNFLVMSLVLLLAQVQVIRVL